MASKRDPGGPRRSPARSSQQREDQLVALAYDAAEKVIRGGNATSQLLTHFLKLGTAREALERQRLEREVELLKAKSDNLNKQGMMETLMGEALSAFKTYSGHGDDGDYVD